MQKKGFILLIDSGNSRLKCRALSVDKRKQTTLTILANATISNHTPQQLYRVIDTFIQDFGDLYAVYAISVASQELQDIWNTTLQHFLNETLRKFVDIKKTSQCEYSLDTSNQQQQNNTQDIQTFPQKTVQWLAVEKACLGLSNHYHTQQMGKDRWYGVLGAYCQAKAVSVNAFLSISFGTATTIDTVIGNDYVGGVILPGVQLMQKSLFQGTAKLPEVPLFAPNSSNFPKNTEQAIASGIIVAQVGAVLQQIQKVYNQYQQIPALYISGGARSVLMSEIKKAYQQWIAQILPSDKKALVTDIPLVELESPVLDGMQAYLLNRILG